MSWGASVRNAVGLGLGGVPSVLNAPPFAALKLNFTEVSALDPRITFTRASSATYFNSAGVLSTAANDVARFDRDPITRAPLGLLIEESRTNLCLYSSDLNQANWLKGASVSLSYDTTTAPDGTTTGDTITVVTGADTGVYQSIACSSSTAYTFSLWVKLGTMVAADYKFAIYDNTNAAFIAADIVPTQTPSSTAWTRVTYTFTTPATCVSVRVYCFRNSLSAASSVNIWGMQLEQGAFATSYVTTTTTALTRAADLASMTGANFSNWYNPLEGTTVVQASTLPNVTSSVLTYAISDNTFNNSMYGNFTSGNTYRGANVLVGGVAQAGDIGSFTGLVTTNNTKDAFTYKLNRFAESCNGAATRTDVSGTTPVVDRMYLGTNWNGTGNFLNGYIRSFSYYRKQLSSGQLQALTK